MMVVIFIEVGILHTVVLHIDAFLAVAMIQDDECLCIHTNVVEAVQW